MRRHDIVNIQKRKKKGQDTGKANIRKKKEREYDTVDNQLEINIGKIQEQPERKKRIPVIST